MFQGSSNKVGAAMGGALTEINPDNYAELARTAGIAGGKALEAVGMVAMAGASAGPPLSLVLGPLGMAIGKTVQAANLAKGNKQEADMLAQRASDVGAKMKEVVETIQRGPVAQAQSVSNVIERLTQVLEETAGFLAKFGKKGFLSKMMSGEVDARTFAKLDKRILDHSNELGSTLDLQNLVTPGR